MNIIKKYKEYKVEFTNIYVKKLRVNPTLNDYVCLNDVLLLTRLLKTRLISKYSLKRSINSYFYTKILQRSYCKEEILRNNKENKEKANLL